MKNTDAAVEQTVQDYKTFLKSHHNPLMAIQLATAAAINRTAAPQPPFGINELMKTRAHLFRLHAAAKAFSESPGNDIRRSELDQLLVEISVNY